MNRLLTAPNAGQCPARSGSLRLPSSVLVLVPAGLTTIVLRK